MFTGNRLPGSFCPLDNLRKFSSDEAPPRSFYRHAPSYGPAFRGMQFLFLLGLARIPAKLYHY